MGQQFGAGLNCMVLSVSTGYLQASASNCRPAEYMKVGFLSAKEPQLSFMCLIIFVPQSLLHLAGQDGSRSRGK